VGPTRFSPALTMPSGGLAAALRRSIDRTVERLASPTIKATATAIGDGATFIVPSTPAPIAARPGARVGPYRPGSGLKITVEITVER
jgi:hypothetical protein